MDITLNLTQINHLFSISQCLDKHYLPNYYGIYFIWHKYKVTCTAVQKNAVAQAVVKTPRYYASRRCEAFISPSLAVKFDSRCTFSFEPNEVNVSFNGFSQDIDRLPDVGFQKVKVNDVPHPHTFYIRREKLLQIVEHTSEEVVFTQDGWYVPSTRPTIWRFCPKRLSYATDFRLVVDTQDLKTALKVLKDSWVVFCFENPTQEFYLTQSSNDIKVFLKPLVEKC